MRRIAIIQSAYAPWRGFFDLINRCDEYIIFDSVQFVKRHWHNRNRIYTNGGVKWITIPVSLKTGDPIESVTFSDPDWARSHWKTIDTHYRASRYFDVYAPIVRELYREVENEKYLTLSNEIILRGLTDLLGIKTKFVRDVFYTPQGVRSDRLLDICQKANATHYVSGPSAKAYLEIEKFSDAGITVEWMEYPAYPTYKQVYDTFEPAVTILDLIFNVGPRREMWSSDDIQRA